MTPSRLEPKKRAVLIAIQKDGSKDKLIKKFGGERILLSIISHLKKFGYKISYDKLNRKFYINKIFCPHCGQEIKE